MRGWFPCHLGCQCRYQVVMCESVPLRIAAFPDLIAKEAMLAMTSGRASKMIKRTPIGHVTLCSSRPSSSLVLNVVLLTISYTCYRSNASQHQRIVSPSTVVQGFCKHNVRAISLRILRFLVETPYQDLQALGRLIYPAACPPICLSFPDPASSGRSD